MSRRSLLPGRRAFDSGGQLPARLLRPPSSTDCRAAGSGACSCHRIGQVWTASNCPIARAPHQRSGSMAIRCRRLSKRQSTSNLDIYLPRYLPRYYDPVSPPGSRRRAIAEHCYLTCPGITATAVLQLQLSTNLPPDYPGIAVGMYVFDIVQPRLLTCVSITNRFPTPCPASYHHTWLLSGLPLRVRCRVAPPAVLDSRARVVSLLSFDLVPTQCQRSSCRPGRAPSFEEGIWTNRGASWPH